MQKYALRAYVKFEFFFSDFSFNKVQFEFYRFVSEKHIFEIQPFKDYTSPLYEALTKKLKPQDMNIYH